MHTHRKRDNFDFRRADDDFFSHKQKHIQRLDYEEQVVWQSVHTQQFTDNCQILYVCMYICVDVIHSLTYVMCIFAPYGVSKWCVCVCVSVSVSE